MHIVYTKYDVVCCSNWTGFEGSAADSTFNQQFTIATESLNALVGTVRPGNYDSQVLPAIGGNGQGAAAPFLNATTNCSFYIPQSGANVSTNQSPIIMPGSTAINWYHAALSLEQAKDDAYGSQGQWGANYQFNIDSKLYPQFQADVHDAWHLLRNMFDANALSLTYGSSIQTFDQFTQAYFGLCIGLDHHADDAGKDHLISGLNTTGSLIPIVFTGHGNIVPVANNPWFDRVRTMCGGSFRPTVFANLTSTLMVYQGRVISVVN